MSFLKNDYRTRSGKQVQTFTIISYMSCLRNALNTAVREDIILEHPINKRSPARTR
ncbi:MAG: phage integrase SAM-like domain-containing protein [Bacteroidales bacterium]|nr:MAG: phage integrase SAM-like domain-containing protein [Bacteroidales bacterium]